MDEWVDVVDENDRVIGRKTRGECHNGSGLLHRCVHYTLIDRKNKKILITQRSMAKSHDAGAWCFMGEHVLSGEGFGEAVVRGVDEEMGYRPTIFSEAAMTIFRMDGFAELCRFFVVEWESQDLKFDRNEFEAIKWLSVSELLSGIDSYPEMMKYWMGAVSWKDIFIEV